MSETLDSGALALQSLTSDVNADTVPAAVLFLQTMPSAAPGAHTAPVECGAPRGRWYAHISSVLVHVHLPVASVCGGYVANRVRRQITVFTATRSPHVKQQVGVASAANHLHATTTHPSIAF